MATVSLSVTENTDGTATVVDGTSFTSPARSGVGVFVKIYKYSASSVGTAVVVTSDDSDPETDSEWTFDTEVDGWYQARYVGIPDYSGGTAYTQYQCAFDPSTNLAYKAVQASTGQSLANATYWTVLTAPADQAVLADTATEATNIDSAVYNFVIFTQVKELVGDKAIAAANEETGVEVSQHYTESDREYDFVLGQYEAAQISELRQQFSAAERYVRRLDDFLV